ncbi:MAG: type I-E CRISPR-associated protein Cse2/CasB [Gammaproteobacteria bacterium]|nr:type I-E CRISPR-associated protein Cse2/CasB [Gammaproteobacteria bacterium]
MSQVEDSVGNVVIKIAKFLSEAEPGELAELRRMNDKFEARMFWRLSAQYERIAKQPEKWSVIVKMLALLTPTGSREAKESVHDGKRPLGAVLCDGGETGTVERPLLSENRLARLLVARDKIRLEALERAVRLLARNQVKLNTVELAWAVIAPDKATARIAKAYYKRLDSIAKDKTKEEYNDE